MVSITYRFVPARWRLMAQLATLLGTALVGLSIYLTPEKVDPKLSQIERTMNADVWAILLMVFGLLGFVCETYSVLSKRDTFFLVVSACHIVLFAEMLAYSVSALSGVLLRAPWAFAGPVLGVLLAIWHYIYIQRKPRLPSDILRADLH